jgi:ELWxxDGT repeat protein
MVLCHKPWRVSMRFPIAGALSLVVLGCLAQPAKAEDPRLVADLFPSPFQIRPEPTGLTPAGDKVVFVAHDYFSSFLWASDGTREGTTLLAELTHEYYSVRSWGTLGNLAFFAVGEAAREYRVWRTDGTAAGTYPLTRRIPYDDYLSRPAFAFARTLLYFTSCRLGSWCEVWSTDGTVEGTRVVGGGPFSSPPIEMVALDDDVYFFLEQRSLSGVIRGLWRASAKLGRVELVRSLEGYASDLLATGGRLFFFAGQVWTSDGTAAGTIPVTQFASQWLYYGLLAGFDGKAWFVAGDPANGEELWSTDGTVAGTRRATNLPDPSPFSGELLLAKIGRRILFPARYQGNVRLWTTTGNLLQTSLLSGCPDGCPIGLAPTAIVTSGGRAFFIAGDSQLWVTDGTGAGTRRLYYGGVLDNLSEAGGLVFFRANGYLWSSDGTAGGTVGLAGAHPASYYGQQSSPAAAAGRVFFPAIDAEGTGSLWTTKNGGPAEEVFALPPGNLGSEARPVGTIAGRLLFQACSPSLGCSVFGTDGWELEPLFVPGDTDPAVSAGNRALVITRFEGTLRHEILLWGTDGTRGGTVPIPLPEGWCGSPPIRFQNRAFFAVSDRCSVNTGAGTGLWSSDGTVAGTLPLALLALPSAGYTSPIASDGRTMCFALQDYDEREAQVLCSDGTRAGTAPLGPRLRNFSSLALLSGRVYFLLARESSTAPAVLGGLSVEGQTTEFSLGDLGAKEPRYLTAAAGRLWFAAQRAGDQKGRWWLWTSDGTAEGTRRLPPEIPFESFLDYNSETLKLTVFAGRVYFPGMDDRHGMELWSSDGTVAGTRLVVDLAPGPGDGAPLSNVVVRRGRLYFAGNDMKHGVELWSSDGTAAGTRLKADLFPGRRWSWPQDLAVLGNRLFFGARDETHGRELWVLDGGGAGAP